MENTNPLDDFAEEAAPETNVLDEMAPSQSIDKTPVATLRNKAATIAILNGKNPEETYREVLQQSTEGVSLPSTSVAGSVVDRIKVQDDNSVMSILGSSEYTMEQKQKILANRGKPNVMNEDSSILFTQGLQAESKGESVKEEEARLNVTNMMREVIESRQQVQGYMNKWAAGFTGDMVKAADDFAKGILMPGATSEMAIETTERTTTWGKLKAFFAPGSSKAEIKDKYADLPPREAAAFILSQIEKIKNVDGFIIDKNDEINKLQFMQDITEGSRSSSVDVILDNIAPYADLLGLGVLAKGKGAIRFFNKAAKGVEETNVVAKGVEETNVVAKTVAEVPPTSNGPKPIGPVNAVPDYSLVSKVPTPPVATAEKAKQLDQLIREKAQLLEGVNAAGRGDIAGLRRELKAVDGQIAKTASVDELAETLRKGSSPLKRKAAKTEASKRLSDLSADLQAQRDRIVKLIDDNASSAKVEQRIGVLEEQISSLQKGLPANPGSVPNKITDILNGIEWNSVVRLDPPGSVGNILASANPSQARNLFKAAVKGSGDEISLAVYGTPKTDVLVANLAPQAVSDTGRVVTKVPEIDRELKVPKSVESFTKGGEGLGFTNKELAETTDKVVNDFTKTTGLVSNEAMGGVKHSVNGDTVSFNAVFGTSEGGWSKASEAIEQAAYALRSYGVKPENIELMKMDGIHHIPTTLKEAGDTPGNYLVRVKTDYQMSFNDVGSPEWLRAKWNWADYLPTTLWENSGQLSRWIMDSASIMHGAITGPGVRAVDIGAKLTSTLLKEAKLFTDKMEKFSKARRTEINKYLMERNFSSLPDDQGILNQNFSHAERDAITAFRNYWDTHFFLENHVAVKTVDSAGFKIMDNASTRQIAREVPEQFKGRVTRSYDPADGKVYLLDEAARDKLYASGGSYAEFRRPQTFNGREVEHMIVRNTPQEYLRKLTNSDEVLTKRPSYFTVYYKAAKFVDKIKLDKAGNEISRRAVAVSGDSKEANAFVSRQTAAPDEKYRVRNDDRAVKIGSDDWWDVESAGGRIATRHRGQTLVDASGMNHLGMGEYIADPIDAAVRAARSVGQHVPMSEAINNAKARFMKQYAEFLPSNGKGGKAYPGSFGDIGAKGVNSRDLADARATWGHIRYLENGYLNSLDIAGKHILGKLADFSASMGFSKGERILNNAATMSAASALRTATFKALIATHPLRQMLVQSHQVARLLSYDPVGVVKALKRVPDYYASKMGKTPTDFTKFVDESGMVEAIDEHNLIRTVTENYVDHTNKVLRKAALPVEIAQKIGFNAGEEASIVGHLAVVYNRFEARGLNLADKRVRGQALSEARAIMGDMNRAGDMPYNQNWAGLAMQFMQVPHKMFLQATNRRIPIAARARLVMGDLAIWGIPAWMVQNAFTEDLVPDPELRKQLVEGAESTLVNAALQDIFQSEYSVDFSSLAPNDMSGWYALVDTVIGASETDVLLNSPTGRLLGKNGRVQHALHMMSRWFKGVDNSDASPVEFMTMATEVSKVMSGVNDFHKAMLIKNLGEQRDTYGNLLNGKTPEYAAWFQMMGLGDKDTKWMWETIKAAGDIKKHNKEDVRAVYKETLKAYYAMDGKSLEDAQSAQRFTGELLNVYKDNPEAQGWIMSWAQKDALDSGYKLYDTLTKMSGIGNSDEVRRLIEMSNVPADDKSKLLERFNDYSINIKKED